MTVSQKQAIQQADLHSQLWNMANALRGNMDASEFKNYILGLIFYRYLSENLELYVNEAILNEDKITYEEAWERKNYREELKKTLVKDNRLGYYIQPKYLYKSMIKEIETGKFDISMLAHAVNELTESTLGNESQHDFENLFDDMDLNSSKLGRGEKERTKLISTIMLKINDIDFHHGDFEIDVLGDAYEYLIGNFAASAGKKAGEFYTPQQVSKILAKIVTLNKKDLVAVYDPTCGSGSLLLRVKKEANVRKFYGQEKTSTTYNLARMNMLLHGVSFKYFDIRNDDTLIKPQHLDMKFEAIVANPPYSAQWSADPSFLDDERFSVYGKLAPKSKADFAFIQHMIYQLDDKGTMAVVLPHGVLFRGASEGTIRQYLIEEKNYLDAVIGLPANIFFGTNIPTCILVFKKCRENSDNILFIDASNEFEPGKNQNRLTDKNVEKILNTYSKRVSLDKYSHVASLNEIKENNYNLNIPRYVDSFEEENEIDINDIQNRLEEINKQIEETDEQLNKYLKELGLSHI